MEVTRKKIGIDSFKSHKNGIMPYIKVGESEINAVESVNCEGNYGSFVCDFVLVSAYTYTNADLGITVHESKELSRLRYLDVIRKYNFSRRQILDSVLVTRVEGIESTINKINCETNESSITTTIKIKWSPNVDDSIGPYNSEPLDIGLFYEKEGMWYYDEKNTKLKNKIEYRIAHHQEVSEEELSFVEKINHTEQVLSVATYLCLVPNYDIVKRYDKWWENWWEECFAISSYPQGYYWEMFVFETMYRTPAHFKFVQDVEKYVIGKILVPEIFNGQKIEGTKVPNVVSYLDFYERKDWFEANRNYITVDEELMAEWKRRGGDAFYNFLCSVDPKFLPNVFGGIGDGVHFSYAKPYITLPINLIDEGVYEKSYRAYEYNVDVNGNIEEYYVDYVAPIGGQGTDLTPFYEYDWEDALKVESKLELLSDSSAVALTDELYGILETYNSSGNSQLFECTFYSGYSSQSQLDKFVSCDLYEYAKNGNEYVLVNTIHIPKTFDRQIRAEVPAKTKKSGVKQVVGIKNLGYKNGTSAVTVNQSTQVVNADFGGTSLPVSSFTYTTGETEYIYSWCECKPITYNSTFKCGDGEDIDFSNLSLKKYRNVTLLSCIPSYVESTANGKSYYFMAKYKNGNYNRAINEPITRIKTVVPLRLPYIVGKPQNIVSFDGEYSGTTIYDVVTSMNITGDTMKITYIMGATSGQPYNWKGIHYEEVVGYASAVVETFIDNMFDAEVYVENITKQTQTTYSDDYLLERESNSARITGMEIGTQWVSGAAITAPLFTDDTIENTFEYPKVDVDIIFNRGNAAAWEKHFKLSECNTFDDLEKYGNGFFIN